MLIRTFAPLMEPFITILLEDIYEPDDKGKEKKEKDPNEASEIVAEPDKIIKNIWPKDSSSDTGTDLPADENAMEPQT